MKIAIGMPTTGTIKYQTAFCLIRLLRSLSFPHMMIFRYGSLIHRARETIIEEALENECTHVLFVDSDMFFEQDALNRLLERKKEIVGVDCNFRKTPPTSTLRETKKQEKNTDEFKIVDGVGTGFLLVDLSVFKKIKKPWFFFETEGEGLGEDYWFCKRAKELGFDIWVDKTVKIGHIGDYVY